MQVHTEDEFRDKVRETVIELLENDRERFYPVFLEIMEDIALSKAMEDGEQTPEVPEDTILQLLNE
jgi:hypothetical protein